MKMRAEESKGGREGGRIKEGRKERRGTEGGERDGKTKKERVRVRDSVGERET